MSQLRFDKKSIGAYFSDNESEGGPFLIPVYQRPYTWSEDEELQTLIDDLYDFMNNPNWKNRENFLGCIVSYNNNKKREIIDGQQRITTLFLMLRALYAESYNELERYKSKPGFNPLTDEHSEDYKMAENLCNRIKVTLWDCDDKGEPILNQIRLESNVNNDKTNAILKKILETGKAEEDANDQYSKNYRRIQEFLAEYSENHKASGLKTLVDIILDKTIVLPIWADDMEMALTIFDTLNDRGKPLSDADIFKAKIYESIEEEDKKNQFIETWKQLETEVDELADESMQKLFTYYMYYLRGKNNDISTTTIAVRKYYKGEDNTWSKLLAPDLISNLGLILNIFKVIYRHEDEVRESWAEDIEIRKSLDIIRYYPNEYWKYPVITYYLEHRNKDTFAEDFKLFLHKLISQLLTRFIYQPSLNYVKSSILNLDATIKHSTRPNFEFKEYDEKEFKTKIQSPKDKITRMLLAVIAYNCGKGVNGDITEKINSQKHLLPEKWEIEHVFPQKYKKTNYPDMTTEQITEIIECIGNKIPLEKKINCEASDGYFIEKKKKYEPTSIALAKDSADSSLDDWTFDNINERKIHTADEVAILMKKWDKI